MRLGLRDEVVVKYIFVLIIFLTMRGVKYENYYETSL